MWRIDWKNVKTLTIKDCDPEKCRFERCPMHAGNDNPFPVKGEAQEDGPGVLAISCNQNPLLAKALIAFANKLTRKKGGHHGAVVEHVGGERSGAQGVQDQQAQEKQAPQGPPKKRLVNF